jgi:hypothetical protein
MHALRCVGQGQADVILAEHRALLIRMGLASVNASGRLELTEASCGYAGEITKPALGARPGGSPDRL